MLSGKLALHDLADTEGLCAHVIQRSSLNLSYHEHEDLLTYLVETAWELSLTYRPGAGPFSAYAAVRLRQRCTDWKRSQGRTRWQFSNRTYERTLPSFTTLDDRPDGSDPSSTVDVDRVRELDLRRLLGTRSGGPTWRDGEVGQAPHRCAA